ncbi:Alpha/Beta hydrolase protein [Rhizoctonia solani]|nr:Alpha/Beta hydrolase protein [Rhizoctonia solani]
MHSRLYLTFLSTVFSYTYAASIPTHLSFTPAESDSQTVLSKPHVLRTRVQTVHQPRSIDDVYRVRERSLRLQQSEPIEWVKKNVLAPDVTDRETLRELAKMTANAYAKRGKPNWWEMSERWNTSFPFGWEPDEDGFRGQVFISDDENIVVMSIKGTSIWTPIGDKTSKKDKLNDNLLFSCCCARVDWTWHWQTVCDCYSGHNRCDQTCLSASLIVDSLFYSTGVELYKNLTAAYPDANIWLTGHSLGGSLAALLGATFGVPTVTFESPGERLASTRLHIPTLPDLPYSEHPITHVWHTGDPIPDGRCVGPASLCAKGGYALETRCRNGKHIVYDTVTKKKWAPSIAKHRIGIIINDVLGEDWDEDRAVPEAVAYDDCEECTKWTFGDFIDPDPKKFSGLGL